MEDWKIGVRLSFDAPLSYSEVTPILDELEQQFRSVKTSRFDARGLAMGGPGTHAAIDLLIDLGQIATALLVKDLLSELAKDAYKGMRSAILRFREKRSDVDSHRGQPSFSIRIGSLWFIFRTPLTDKEFVEALRAARALADELPDVQVNHPLGSTGGHYDWDPAFRSWQGPLFP